MGCKEGALHAKGEELREGSGPRAGRGETGGGHQALQTAVERRADPGPSRSAPAATALHAVPHGGSGKEAKLKAGTRARSPARAGNTFRLRPLTSSSTPGSLPSPEKRRSHSRDPHPELVAASPRVSDSSGTTVEGRGRKGERRREGTRWSRAAAAAAIPRLRSCSRRRDSRRRVFPPPRLHVAVTLIARGGSNQ